MEINDVKSNKNKAIINHNYKLASELKDKQLELEIVLNKNAFKNNKNNIIKEISKDTIYDVVYAKTKIPVKKLLNLDKNNIEGYIGYESFAELSYLIIKKIEDGLNHKIYIYKMPSEEVGCYNEIKQFLDLGYIDIYK